MNEFMGSTLGGQNPYAGRDTGFGDFLRKPQGNFDSVDPAQAGYTGAVAPNFNVPNQQGMNPNQQMGGMGNGTMNPQTLSMMLSLLRNR